MSHDNDHAQRVVDLIQSSTIAMLTHVDPTGKLVSHPMATQEADYDGTVRFIAERSSDKAVDVAEHPEVNVSYSNNGSWVSLSGQARVVDDRAKLEELWDSFTSSWLEGGPENPDNILLEVTPESAEYWDAPGGRRLVQLANLVKAKVTGARIDSDHGTVDL